MEHGGHKRSCNRRTAQSFAASFAAGATALHVASLLLLLACAPVQLQAAWGWGTLPTCALNFRTGLACVGGSNVIQAGWSCIPNCSGGLFVSCDEPIRCPASDQNDIGNDQTTIWWDHCGGGSVCRGGSYGVDASVLECLSTRPAACDPSHRIVVAEEFEPIKELDFGVFIVLGAILVLSAFGITMVQLLPKPSRLYRMLIRSKVWLFNFSVGSLVLLLLLVLIATVMSLVLGAASNVRTEEYLRYSDAIGIVAACFMMTPMVWSFWRFGVDHAFAVSREAGWKIHAALGIVAMCFGLVHGIMNIIGDRLNSGILGLVGLSLLLVAATAGGLHVFIPGFVSYDIFKLVHMLNFIGYAVLCRHVTKQTTEISKLKYPSTKELVPILMWTVLGLSVAQKIWTEFWYTSTTMISSTVCEGSEGYVFLHLRTKSAYKWMPGQWGHLALGYLGVSHPFTIVPAPKNAGSCELQFFIKATGPMTQNLKSVSSSAPIIRLKGPYGIPPLPNGDFGQLDAVCFILGGVGVTPALSMAKATLDAGKQVRVYWSLRSPALLERSASFFEVLPHDDLYIWIDPRFRGHGELPLKAHGAVKVSISDWISQQALSLNKDMHQRVGVFVCGPRAMAKDAESAINQSNNGLDWHLHVEEFRFLPGSRAIPKWKLSASDQSRVQPENIGITSD